MIDESWRYLLTVEGRPVELSDGEVTLGRSRTATIRLEHDSVSRSHALLTLQRGDAAIRDLNSSNGTWIGGRRITGEVPLQDGTRIQLGAAVVVLRILPPSGALSERTALLESGGGAPPEAIAPGGVPPAPPPASPSTASNLFAEIDREAMRSVSEPLIHEEILQPDQGLPQAPVPSPSIADVSLAISAPPVRESSSRSGGAELRPEQAEAPVAETAPLGPRFTAALVDAVILSAMNLVLLSPVFLISYFQPALKSASAGEDRAFLGILALCGILVFAADLLYTVGLWAFRGRTPGKSLLKLAIVRHGRPPGDGIGWGPALLRGVAMGAGALPLFAGWWSAALRKDRRAWHDLAAGTRVVRMR
ncbi:MAG: FHA domain-containing protein [Thermoanaerobaculia bacterium]